MKVFAYLAMSVNGYIAKPDDNVDWVSETQWENYQAAVKEAGCAIVGHRTYSLMEDDEFVPGCFYVVPTSKPFDTGKDNVLATDKSPSEIVKLLAEKNFQEACLVGGSKTVTTFLEARVVDEIRLDIEPIVLGKGINLVSSDNLELNLKLKETKMLNDSLIQLRYEVIK